MSSILQLFLYSTIIFQLNAMQPGGVYFSAEKKKFFNFYGQSYKELPAGRVLIIQSLNSSKSDSKDHQIYGWVYEHLKLRGSVHLAKQDHEYECISDWHPDWFPTDLRVLLLKIGQRIKHPDALALKKVLQRRYPDLKKFDHEFYIENSSTDCKFEQKIHGISTEE